MSKTKEIKAPKWEIKNRTYYLAGGLTPLTYTLSSKNSARSQLMWFDDSTGTQREIRYATNQASPFVDEQKGEVTLGHIMFQNGELKVKDGNGKFTSYYENTQWIRSEGYYKDGIVDGKWTFYDENGQITWESNWKDGVSLRDSSTTVIGLPSIQVD